MIPRRLLTTLVYALPLLVVLFGVVMGAGALTRASGDLVAAKVLHWVGGAAMLLIAADLILLVGFLGLEAISREDHDSNSADS